MSFRVVCGALMLTALFEPAYADAGRVFCQGSLSFIERPKADGAIAFRFVGANDQDNIMTVEGVAVPHKGGWRYQVKSDAVPDDRCTLDITATGEEFTLHTVEGARCVSYGGYAAYILLTEAAFTGRSMVRGVTPALGPDERLLDFDCDKRKFLDLAN